MARPSVITPEILESLRTAFAMGCTDEEAAALLGVSTKTIVRYTRKGMPHMKIGAIYRFLEHKLIQWKADKNPDKTVWHSLKKPR